MDIRLSHVLPLAALLVFGGFLACDPDDEDTGDTGDADTDTDTDTDCTPATVEQVCDHIFTVCPDHWGWPSQQECYAGFIGSETMQTECADEAGYFACVCACLDIQECQAFGDCEWPCWQANCESESGR